LIVERAKLYSLNLSKITENAIFSIIDFLDAQRSKSRLKAILTFPLSLSMLFIHGGAWGMTIGILVVYLLLTILKRQTRTNSFEIRLLIAIISINIVAGILRNYALGWSAGGFETLRQAQVALKPTSLASFWDDTLFTFLHTMYGFFINPLAILLAFIGALIIVHDDSPLNRYLTSWLIIFQHILCSHAKLGNKKPHPIQHPAANFRSNRPDRLNQPNPKTPQIR
jgi:hypothetical protein